jgi:riboflavin kinase/FMN adenylyltransferase
MASTPAGICAPTEPTGRPPCPSAGVPTFYERAELSLLEAYLLDFDGDLYGEAARVEFVAHLRGQVRFDSVDDLIDQMNRDVAVTREILGVADMA